MTRHTFAKLVAAASLVVSAPAFACSIFIDEPAEKRRLISVAQAELGATDAQISFTEVRDFRPFESKPGRTCPDAISFSGTVYLWHASQRCAAVFEVTRTAPLAASGQDTHYVVRQISDGCFGA